MKVRRRANARSLFLGWSRVSVGDIQDCIDHLIVAENAERLKESEL